MMRVANLQKGLCLLPKKTTSLALRGKKGVINRLFAFVMI